MEPGRHRVEELGRLDLAAPDLSERKQSIASVYSQRRSAKKVRPAGDGRSIRYTACDVQQQRPFLNISGKPAGHSTTIS